ncbi:hypothetical protein [Photobacterium sp. 1_MG-2023]|uniref:hypothetical protein n=1 Tax=Photobacterium sp. 1_MG-2023 TaxID=3062646 RepID=UPI0026E186E0|nr:hypothetical protein [Photobacterium sp. 1_MG-2023]MDO6708419.1 hypothetical protein [Photobacterium sp. 1_MG-2023]
MKKSLLAVVIPAVMLAGCGGGSDSDAGPNPDEQGAATIQVIDGYLSNAEVCVDRNRNQACDAGELLTNRTDAKGQVNLTAADRQYPLIARIIAGETSDNDQPDAVWQDTEFYAEAGSLFLSPFTTMAHLNQQSLSDFAASLNLDASLLAQDYVALAATNPDAEKIHLYARSIMKMLGETLAANNTETQKLQVQGLKTFIQTLANQNVDLGTVDLSVDEQGTVTRAARFTDLAGYLDGRTLYTTFLNTFEYEPRKNIFKNGTLHDPATDFTSDYEVTGLKLKSDLLHTNFLYVDDAVALSFMTPDRGQNASAYNLLSVWSERDVASGDNTYLTAEDFVGQTWYHLRDLASIRDGRAAASKPAFTEIRFGAEGRIEIQPRGEEAFDASWTIVPKNELPNPNNPPYMQIIRIPYGDIALRESLAGAKGMVLQTLFHHQDIVIAKEMMNIRFDEGEVDAASIVLLTRNKALAEAIYQAWQQ